MPRTLWRFRTLGALDLSDSRGHVARSVLTQPKRLGLLTYLALARPRGFHRRDTVMALLWPDLDAEHARSALRQAVHHLRRALGPDVIEGRGDELGVAAGRLDCDGVRFDEAVETGAPDQAMALYGGDLLPGFFVGGADEFERWLDDERRRLRERAADAARGLAERELDLDRAPLAAQWGRRALALQPDAEETVRWLMTLLGRAGDRAAALALYEEFARRLQADFDAEPSVETRRVRDELRSRAAEAPAVPPPGPAPAPTDSASRATPVLPIARPQLLPPPARRGSPVPSPARRITVVAMVAVGALVVAALTWIVRDRWQPSSTTPRGDAVAVMPFTVVGTADAPFVRDALTTLLASRLDGAGTLRAVDPRAVAALVGQEPMREDEDRRARALAGRLRASYYVTGSATGHGGVLSVRAALFEVGGKPRLLAQALATGRADQVIALADTVALELLAGRVADTASAFGARLTTSVPALRAFLQGEVAYRAGRYEEALPSFRLAVRLDTTFALAYYRLSVSADWSNQGDEAVPAALAASRFAAALSPRQQEIVAGYHAYMTRDAVAAEWHYRNLLSQNPEDVEALIMLGETLFHFNADRGRAFSTAKDPFERALALEPDNANTLLHLARLAAFEGRNAAAADLTRRFLAIEASGDRAIEARALQAYVTNDQREWHRVTAQLDSASAPVIDWVRRAIAVFTGNVNAANLLAPALDQPQVGMAWRVSGHLWSAQFAAALGHWRDVSARLAEAAAEDPESALELGATLATTPHSGASDSELVLYRNLLRGWYDHSAPRRAAPQTPRYYDRLWGPYLAGLISVRLGDSAGAGRDLAALRRVPTDSVSERALPGLDAALDAAILHLQGRTWAALQTLERANLGPRSLQAVMAFHALAFERYLHAQLLEEVGRPEEANRWYASFPAPDGWDLPYLASAEWRRGVLAERAGARQEAASHFATVIQLRGTSGAVGDALLDSARAGLGRVSD